MSNWALPSGLTSALRLLGWQGAQQRPAVGPTPAPARAKDTLVLSPAASTGAPAGKIQLDTAKGQYIKDPSFANNGQPIGNGRYVAFGNLRRFYLKGFDLDAKGLSFKPGEIPIQIDGLAPGLDGVWAPQVVVTGDTVRLFYTAGKMPPGGLDWPSFRLHEADIPLADFQAAAEAGQPVHFRERGTLFDDQICFGGKDRDFGMIDPSFYMAPDGKAYMTYTVVKAAIPGVRRHEEFVRSRQVDPTDPAKAIGPDRPLVDGWAGGRHDGVAEAQDLVTYNGQPYLFVSSRAGDKDQRVLVAPVGADLGRVADGAWHDALKPGGTPWASDAVGSTSAAELDGKLYMLYQGMNAQHQFSLGWQAVQP